jgi:hypothetical protein
LLSNALAQETERSIERVVVAAPELGPTNASAVDPDVLGLTGDFRRIEDVMPNVSINDAGADSFEDVLHDARPEQHPELQQAGVNHLCR